MLTDLNGLVASSGGWLVALGSLLIVAAASPFAVWLGAWFAWGPLRRTSPDHWMERARLVYPGQMVIVSGPVMLFFLAKVQAEALASVLSPVAAEVLAWLLPLAALLSAGWMSARVDSRLKQRAITLADWLRTWAVLVVIYLPHVAVFGLMLINLPYEVSVRAIGIVVAAFLVALLFTLEGGLVLAQWVGLLRPAPARLLALVEIAAQRVGTRPRGVYLLRMQAANAIAFPVSRRIAVTETALAELGDEELTAICAHELGHLNEPGRVKLARVLGQFVWMPIFAFPLVLKVGGFFGLLATVALCLLARRMIQRLQRSMETRADGVGHAHEGDPGTYARALEKLHQINLIPAVMYQKRLAHPHLYDRMVEAGVPPSVPRPDAPSRWRGLLAILVLMGTASAVWMAWWIMIA